MGGTHLQTVNFRSGYLGSSLGGAKVAHGNNGTFVLASAKAWLLIYHLQFYPDDVSYASGLWEKVRGILAGACF